MNTIDIRRNAIVLILSCAGWGCGPRPGSVSPPDAPPPEQADRLDDFYHRTERYFTLADFHKPDPWLEPDRPTLVAPLIVVERPAPEPDAATRPAGEAPRLTLNYAEAETHFGPVLRRQVTFQWLLPTGNNQTPSESLSGGVVNSATVRFTLTEVGAPMIVEHMPRDSSDSTGPLVIFVSRSLETAALKQFGEPLPHRRFACEPPIDSVPELVVAGVFEDPPDMSGPYLYFTDDWQFLTNVICRCSPSQVGDFVGNEYYKLVPLANGDPAGGSLSFPDPSPLTELLRLPDALP